LFSIKKPKISIFLNLRNIEKAELVIKNHKKKGFFDKLFIFASILIFVMKLIDRYIIQKFFSTFIFVVLLINAVICVIDYGEKSDDFMHPQLTVTSILFDYYLNFALHYTNMLTPITVFITTVFVTAQLAARTEIVAILAAGVSFRRLLFPYFLGSAILAIITFFATGWIIPKANKTKVAFEIEYLKSKYYYDQRDIHFKVAPNTFAYMQNYNNIVNTGYLFTLEEVVDNQLLSKLSAERIEWDSLKQKWHLPSYKIHSFNGDQEKTYSNRNLDTLINLHPKDFGSTHLLWETLTIPQLNEYVKTQISRGNTTIGIFLVEKYQRFTYPFAIIILTIMGVIVSARKSRQGVGMQIAFGFLLAFVFITLVRMFNSLGQTGSISPILAAWIPTILFAGITLVMYKTVPR